MTRQFMSAKQLAEVGPWSEEGIKRMVSRGTLQKGTHWFQPGGPRTRMIFDWLAIQRFIRDEAEPAPPHVVRLANGKEVRIDEEEDREAARLLR